MDFRTVFSKFVINKYILLWEKETKNQEEEKSIPEVMVKEDLKKPQNLLQLQKKNLKNNQNKKDRRSFLRSFFMKIKLIIYLQEYCQGCCLGHHRLVVGFHHPIHFPVYRSKDFLMTETVYLLLKHFQECHLKD